MHDITCFSVNSVAFISFESYTGLKENIRNDFKAIFCNTLNFPLYYSKTEVPRKEYFQNVSAFLSNIANFNYSFNQIHSFSLGQWYIIWTGKSWQVLWSAWQKQTLESWRAAKGCLACRSPWQTGACVENSAMESWVPTKADGSSLSYICWGKILFYLLLLDTILAFYDCYAMFQLITNL